MPTLFQWLTADWRTLMPVPWSHICLCCLAAACGITIGIEREKKEKPTGTRTLALVCLGAAVFTLLSTPDGRIAAQIITGVGFLGAGAIIHSRFGILGLTSASTIWSVAAIGMTIGLGHAGGGIALTTLVYSLLTGISRLETRWAGACKMAHIRIVYAPEGGKTLVQLEGVLDEFSSPGLSIKSHAAFEDDDSEEVTVHYCCLHKHHREVLTRLAEISSVQEMIRDDSVIHNTHVARAEKLKQSGEISAG